MLKGSFPIVAIGASAGGLDAYREFFYAVTPVTGMAFVLIQHLDPTHESMLTEIIANDELETLKEEPQCGPRSQSISLAKSTSPGRAGHHFR